MAFRRQRWGEEGGIPGEAGGSPALSRNCESADSKWLIGPWAPAMRDQLTSQMTRLGSALGTFEERGHERWLILGLSGSPLSCDEGSFSAVPDLLSRAFAFQVGCPSPDLDVAGGHAPC